MTGQLRKFAIKSMVAVLLQKSIPFVTAIYVARAVGSESFATFSFALSTANTVAATSAMGFAPAILTLLACSKSKEESETRVTAIYIMSGIACLIVSIIIWFLGRFYFSTMQQSKELASVAVLAPALILLQTSQSIYQGTNHHEKFFKQSLFLIIVVVLFMFAAVAGQASKDNMILSYSVAFLVVGVFFVIDGLRSLRFSFNEGVAQIYSELKSIVFTQIRFAGYSTVLMIAMYFCNLRVASAFSVQDLAYYNVGLQWYSIMLLIPNTLGGVFIPYFVQNSMDEKSVKLNGNYLTIQFSLIAGLLTLILFLVAPILLNLYGLIVAPAGLNTFRSLVLAGGIVISVTPALQMLMARRQFKVLFIIALTWALVALPGSYYYSRGCEGVALSFLIATFVYSIAAFAGAKMIFLANKS